MEKTKKISTTVAEKSKTVKKEVASKETSKTSLKVVIEKKPFVQASNTQPVKRPEIELPTLEKLLNSGVHFGHKKSRWNPRMAEYIYTEKNGIHIIDVIKTLKMIKPILVKIQEASDKGNVLIVGTKGQASTAVKKMAEEVGAFYIDTRWPGGLFTNFTIIKKSLEKLMKMEERLANGAEGMVKKEQLLMERDVERLNNLYKGIKFMDKLPSLLIVIDSRVEKNAIREARNAGVEVVALIDTNCNPDLVNYPIPANDDSIRSINMFVELFGNAIKGGRKAEGLINLRRDYSLKLNHMKKMYDEEIERKRVMEEVERERMKKLRQGEQKDSTKDKKEVIRVVQKEK